MINKKEIAIFSGGCFWCIESPFLKVPGVIEVIPGYTGGKTENPTYDEVCSGKTGHYEAVRVTYDSSKIGYETLIDIFWRQIDPEDEYGQFADRGPEYRTAIFYQNSEQKAKAEKSKMQLAKSGKFKNIATQILKAQTFYKAEKYHCNFAQKNPVGYKIYKKMSGREAFLEKKWK